MAQCRSCPAPILWALTEAGKRIPLDPDPVEDGNLEMIGTEVVDGQSVPRVRYLKKGEGDVLPGLETPARYKTHFATCPNAKRHRRTA